MDKKKRQKLAAYILQRSSFSDIITELIIKNTIYSLNLEGLPFFIFTIVSQSQKIQILLLLNVI